VPVGIISHLKNDWKNNEKELIYNGKIMIIMDTRDTMLCCSFSFLALLQKQIEKNDNPSNPFC
jgi:hypothetical protein